MFGLFAATATDAMQAEAKSMTVLHQRLSCVPILFTPRVLILIVVREWRRDFAHKGKRSRQDQL
ncbi:hypothetical protein, partial [Pseudomonas sp.]|uniref:hypothetical protein n=1 Tax=Pseudomonas sp. TaxID=306 RepID=UPI003568515A